MAFNKNWKNKDDQIEKVFKTLSDVFDKLSNIKFQKITIDELLNKTTEYVDERVKDICKKKKYVCHGGKLYITSNIIEFNEEDEILDTDVLNLKVEIFFTDISKKWVRSELSGKISMNRMKFEDKETKAFIIDGIKNGFPEIPYNPPE